MNREQNKEWVKSQCGAYLQNKGIDLNKPFRCLNPQHEDRHPSMRFDPARNKAHCFACGADYDIYDLIGIDYGLSEPAQIFRKADELFHLTATPSFFTLRKHSEPQQDDPYLEACCRKAAATDYFARRGLSAGIIERFRLGYDPAFRTQEGGSPAVWRAAIVPTGRGCYLARNLDSKGKDDRIRKRGGSPLFAYESLEGETPVFVVEGEFDALSVYEAGGEAVGLGSTANVPQLVKLCRVSPPACPLILSLDNDEEGEKAAARLEEELGALGVKTVRANIAGEYKDANEALTAEREAFCAAVRHAVEQAEGLEELERQKEREEYLATSAGSHLQEFLDGIAASVDTPCIPTGFPKLDEMLDGGLYEGLYCIGAITSLGKTTFAMQLADQVARAGKDVVIFSLEMARSELMAKSVSRLTLFHAEHPRDAKTARGITDGRRYAGYRPEERALIRRAVEAYSSYAGNLFLHEGMGEIGAAQVRETVERHIRLTGRTPVVLVDYLQLLAPWDIRASDKQNTDRAVLELKRISRDCKTPVLAVSSFNRQNYGQAVTMEAFKESGAIEYSSDVLIGLQAKGAGTEGFRIDEAKRRDPREIELKILKNRNGPTGGTVAFSYYPLFNFFQEEGTAMADYLMENG
ncbi:toprim domain protein [[Clostridium] methylpentosum DSM 5476]|uniref:Toprim domain protein n=1 Tax=[Clostridium] methylpentosum DSM 5476 TaxID=537013 RepID=C0ED98_9FIRM|nr:toprim domain protein [[Clostridium] methylpentosum DSM 5476]MEE1490616.1 DnaB-like helicase C-terminal domain-containing protein [Massilioclostridium sp.]